MEIKYNDFGLGRKFLLSAKNMGFVNARAIAETLKIAQKVQIRFMSRVFKIRKRNLLKNSVKIIQFPRPNNQTGIIAINRNLERIWVSHEKGAEERAYSSTHVAVPVDVRRGKTGMIAKSQRPRNLKRSFLVISKGKKRILQRKGKGKNSKATLVYNLENSITIKPAMYFVRNITRTINKHIEQEVIKSVRKELTHQGVKLS